MITDWIYMSNEEFLDTVVEVLKDFDVEVWKELGVIEVNKEGCSIEFEVIPSNRWDDYCKEILSDLSLSTMYQVYIGKGADKWAEDMMRLICKNQGGRFCGDTEDLNPVIE